MKEEFEEKQKKKKDKEKEKEKEKDKDAKDEKKDEKTPDVKVHRSHGSTPPVPNDAHRRNRITPPPTFQPRKSHEYSLYKKRSTNSESTRREMRKLQSGTETVCKTQTYSLKSRKASLDATPLSLGSKVLIACLFVMITIRHVLGT